MLTNFLGQAYSTRGSLLSSQTAINVYLQMEQSLGAVIAGFFGTPGLKSVFQDSGEVRGLWVSPTGNPGQYWLFAVIGSGVWRFDKNYNATNLGSLPNNSGPVSMADNGIQLSIYHERGMHWVTLTGTAIAPVAGSPSGGTSSALDNYVVFSENIGGEFGITALGDLSSIDPLDVATAEGWPDDCVGVLADHREVWLFGTETTEVWSDTGAAFFPFERVPGGFIEQGCAAKHSPAKIDNSVFWLGRDRNGQGVIYRANSYIPVRISTHAIEFAINNQGIDISDAIGFAYQEEGGYFYQISFPGLDQTWTYDVSAGPSGAWHQRAHKGNSGTLHRHRANCHALFYGDHLVGDHSNGKIYRMSLNLNDDDGIEIYRERAWEIVDPAVTNQRVRIDRVDVTAITGDGGSVVGSGAATVDSSITVDSDLTVDSDGGNIAIPPLMWLQISKDSGRTWGYERFQSLGVLGARKTQARWRRGGSGRNIVFRVATTMRSRVSWVAANVQGEVLGV